jgi:hypothetical protein
MKGYKNTIMSPLETTIRKLLIVPDSHAHPGYDNERFHWLGKFILQEKPDVIVNLGDMADMPSLSSYDKGKGSGENRRHIDDVAATEEALEILDEYEVKARAQDKKAKRKPYAPRKIITLGNHEYRCNRYANDNPELIGTIGTDMLPYASFGYEVKEYHEPVLVGGIAFSHDFPSGISGRPIGGENIGTTLIQKNFMSSVCGHNHLYHHSERTRVDGRKMFGLSAGCYVHPDMIEGWNRATYHLWWRGVVMLENVSEGYYDRINAITMRDLSRL